MTTTLTTDWIKVGQSGPTVDRRRIDPAWLVQAAETYTPDTYTAVIWVDHWRFLGSMGKVVAAKAEKDGDIVSLFVKLQPNEWLLSYNSKGQKLFTSMEIDPDFAETGKAYLIGLAITDEPASLGTHELRFSARKQSPNNAILCGVEFSLDALRDDPATDPTEESRIVAMFRKFVAQFGKEIPHKPGATPEPEEDTMTDEQLQKFAELVGDKVGERLDGLKKDLDQKFAAMRTGDEAADDGGTPAAPDNGKPTFSAEIAEAMQPISTKLDALKQDFTGKVDELTKRFEQVKPGTQAPETDQPATGAKVL